MANGWSYTIANPLGETEGRYLLTLDGEEVGMLSLLDNVHHQPQLMRRVVDALNTIELDDG